MQVGIISDIHDNVWNLQKVLSKLESCEALLCLGDLCAPFTLSAIAEGFAGSVYVVWGNNDGDKYRMGRNATAMANVTLLEEFGHLQLDGREVAMTHYPHLAEALAAGGQFDLVCYGHNHERHMSRMGRTLLLNPGEVMGRLGACSYAIYDTRSQNARIIELEL